MYPPNPSQEPKSSNLWPTRDMLQFCPLSIYVYTQIQKTGVGWEIKEEKPRCCRILQKIGVILKRVYYGIIDKVYIDHVYNFMSLDTYTSCDTFTTTTRVIGIPHHSKFLYVPLFVLRTLNTLLNFEPGTNVRQWQGQNWIGKLLVQ